VAHDPWLIEQLDRRHDRASFDSGVPELNAFLQKHARQNAENNISRTFVAVAGSTTTSDANVPILGYFTLAAGRVDLGAVSPEEHRRLRLARHPVPVILLGRLAVSVVARGTGLGRRLLIEALELAFRASRSIGAVAVEVHAKDDEAKAFYRKYGFVELLDDPHHLWLAMKTIEVLLTKG